MSQSFEPRRGGEFQEVPFQERAGRAKIPVMEASSTLQLGGKGQTLPGAADWRLSNTLSYVFGREMEPTVTVMHRYVSSSPAYLADPTVFDGFNTYNARVSVKLGSVDVAAFVSNIDNKLGETFGNTDYGYGPLRFYIRPRTTGIQVNWKL